MSCTVSPLPPSSPAPFEYSSLLRIPEQDLTFQMHLPCGFSAASPHCRPSFPVRFARATFSDFVQSAPTPTRAFSRFRAGPQNTSTESIQDVTKLHSNDSGKSRVPVAGSAPLDRKRPTRLAIPESARLASLAKAKQFVLSEQEAEIQSFETSLYGVSFKKGRKNCMEDAHMTLTDFQGDAKQAFFGVFDGHGSKHAADFVAENLGVHVSMAIENDHDCKASLEDIMRNAYVSTDAQLLDKCVSGGACSVSAFMKDGRMVIANAGDCKAVLSRGGKAEGLSTLHRASNEEERGRIDELGGLVDCFNGTWRVQGSLAVTRAFGDASLKQWVSVEPAVKTLDITDDCEFLILASDGLWDQMSDQEAVDCVRKIFVESNVIGEDAQGVCSTTAYSNEDQGPHQACQNGSPKHELQAKRDACNQLLHKACDRGNRDDITVMIVLLQAFNVL